MNHLRILKILDWVSVVMLCLVVLFLIGLTAFAVWAVARLDPSAIGSLAPTLMINGVVIALIAGLTVPCFFAARRIERGRGRLAQTVVAVLSLGSVPFGTAFGAYSLWVCWFNEDTKRHFEEKTGPLTRRDWVMLAVAVAIPALLLLGIIGVSIPPMIPTDVDELDAEWEPFADRSQRRDGEGCGLTQVAAATGCEPARPSSVREDEVAFPTRSVSMGFTELSGTLHVPEGLPDPRPAVVLVHGSGPQDRHETVSGELVRSIYGESFAVFDQLAGDLSQRGLVVLQYDKRACAKCYPDQHRDADFGEFRFQLFVDDALAAVDYVASLPEVDPEAIVVIGHSQGGSLAPHIADADERVAAVVLLAGGAGTFSEAVVGQLEDMAETRAAQLDPLTAWALRLQADRYRDCTERIDGDYDPADPCLGGRVTLQALAEYEEMNRTQVDVIGRLDIPLCAIAGTVDRNVSPHHLQRIREAAAGCDAEFHLVGGVGHGLFNLVDPPSPLEIDAAVMERLFEFLGSVKRTGLPRE